MNETNNTSEESISQESLFFNNLVNDATRSDRDIVILICSFLDAMLEEMLREFFVKNKSLRDDFFSNERPSFSFKIELLYLLGLISPKQRQDLNIMRRMRNKFAHTLRDLNFESEDIINHCKELKTNSILGINIPDTRNKLQTNAFMLYHQLILKFLHIKNTDNRTELKDFELKGVITVDGSNENNPNNSSAISPM